MTPEVKITGLSAAANDRLLSVSLTDNASIESDSVNITLDDRDYALEWPEKGKSITVLMGYKETGLIKMGDFEVDQVRHSDSPASKFEITANAQKHKHANVKAAKTQPWDEQTLGDILSTIASRNGYTPDIHPSLASIYYDHLDQTEESDIHFATRLAERHDAYAKFQDGKLLFYPRDETQGSVTIERSRQPQWTDTGWKTIGTSCTASINTRNEYKSVKACWHNEHENQRVYETVGEGDPQHEIRTVYESKEKALNAANAKLQELKRNTGQIENLSIPGDANVRAEMDLTLVGFRPELTAIAWVIKTATHTIDGGGYKTVIKAEVEAPA